MDGYWITQSNQSDWKNIFIKKDREPTNRDNLLYFRDLEKAKEMYLMIKRAIYNQCVDTSHPRWMNETWVNQVIIKDKEGNIIE